MNQFRKTLDLKSTIGPAIFGDLEFLKVKKHPVTFPHEIRFQDEHLLDALFTLQNAAPPAVLPLGPAAEVAKSIYGCFELAEKNKAYIQKLEELRDDNQIDLKAKSVNKIDSTQFRATLDEKLAQLKVLRVHAVKCTGLYTPIPMQNKAEFSAKKEVAQMLHQYRKLYDIDAEVCEEECLQACPRDLHRYQNKEEVIQQRL